MSESEPKPASCAASFVLGEAMDADAARREAARAFGRVLGRKRFIVLALVQLVGSVVAGRMLWALFERDWQAAVDGAQTVGLFVLLRGVVLLGARLDFIEHSGLKVSVSAELVPGPGFELAKGKPKPPVGPN